MTIREEIEKLDAMPQLREGVRYAILKQALLNIEDQLDQHGIGATDQRVIAEFINTAAADFGLILSYPKTKK